MFENYEKDKVYIYKEKNIGGIVPKEYFVGNTFFIYKATLC